MEECAGRDAGLLSDDWRVCERLSCCLIDSFELKNVAGALLSVFSPIADFASELKDKLQPISGHLLGKFLDHFHRTFHRLTYTQFLVSVEQNSHIYLFEFNIVLVVDHHLIDSGSLSPVFRSGLQRDRGTLCDFLGFLKDMELDSAMPQHYKLFSLVATIEATSAGVERSFCCL